MYNIHSVNIVCVQYVYAYNILVWWQCKAILFLTFDFFLDHIACEKTDSRSIALAEENKRLRAELESMRHLINRGEEPVVTGEGVRTSGGGGGGGRGGGERGGTSRTDVVTVCALQWTTKTVSKETNTCQKRPTTHILYESAVLYIHCMFLICFALLNHKSCKYEVRVEK